MNSFKSFIKDYFINIIQDQDNISIQLYNKVTFDNVKYEIEFDLSDMKNLSYHFNTMNLLGIYDILKNLISQNKLRLEKQNNELILSFLMSDIGIIDNNNNAARIQFNLFGEKDTNEYINYLSNEIKNLNKKIDELKTQIYNMSMSKQSVPITTTTNTSIVENTSDDFYNNLFMDINDNIQELSLDKKLINDKIFDYLNKYELNRLIKLNLSYNKIETIKGIETCKFPFLETIHLNNNYIKDLTFLSKANFPELKRLWLFINQINNISPLANANFPKLNILSLSMNDIVDISSLKNFNFPQLRALSLDNNYINEISVLKYTKFKLEKLGLNDNKIINISVFEFADFSELTHLFLYNNSIADASSFGKANFQRLKCLSLNNNKIKNINFLENPLLKDLKELFLNDNQINDLSVFTRINIGFNKLYIAGNYFNANNNSGIISSLQAKIGEFHYK